MLATGLSITLPDWLPGWLQSWPHSIKGETERMAFVVELARRNVDEVSGGPFAAAVFEQESGRLISAAVNRVVPQHASIAHAEMLALSLAQQSLGCHDLGAPGMPAMQLVSSTEPCSMCLGAVPWSGVRSLLCGARDEDARELGFDEGDKPSDWPRLLARRGISVRRDLLRVEAREVIGRYALKGGNLQRQVRRLTVRQGDKVRQARSTACSWDRVAMGSSLTAWGR